VKPTGRSVVVELFGEHLLTKHGLKPTDEVLRGKSAIGIYFSAEVTPPCKTFTPQLVQMYSKAFKSKGMEIVFASIDFATGKGGSRAALWGKGDSKESFQSDYGEMPWAAIPYEKRHLVDKLGRKYEVNRLPSLVILDPCGSVITTEGKKAVLKDPSGKAYPWIPPAEPIWKGIPLDAEKTRIVVDALGLDLMKKVKGKPFGFYFSAHWCPPCRCFTPKLADAYKQGLQDKMEIVFVSSDHDRASFNRYFEEMPWLALPFDEKAKQASLFDAFDISSIPSLVVLNADGAVITTDGRGHVMADPKGENFPNGWRRL
jgi:nucleoredoxin